MEKSAGARSLLHSTFFLPLVMNMHILLAWIEKLK